MQNPVGLLHRMQHILKDHHFVLLFAINYEKDVYTTGTELLIEQGQLETTNRFLAEATSKCSFIVNPLPPVPPITARDEPWPFFHF